MNPSEYKDKNDFIEACLNHPDNQGLEQDNRLGKCESIYDEYTDKHFAEAKVEQEYEIVKDQILFKECDSVDPDTHQPIKFDQGKLQQIVDNQNAALDRGEDGQIIVGHNEDNQPEKPSVGRIGRLKLGFDNGKAAIIGDLKFYKDQAAELIRSFPRKSAEILCSRLLIPQVALLGGNTPALEIGLLFKTKEQLLKFSDNGEKLYAELNIEKDNAMDDAEYQLDDAMKCAFLKLMDQTDVFAWSRAQMAKMSEESSPEEKEEDEGQKEPASSFDDEEQKREEEPKEEVKAEDKKDEESEDKFDEGEQSKKEDEEDDKEELKLKYSHLAKEKAELQTKLRYSERKQTLVGLQYQGYDLDIENELLDSVKMDDESFDRQVGRIQRHYRKAPVSTAKFSTKALNNGEPTTKEELDTIADYAVKNKMSFKDAKQALRNL